MPAITNTTSNESVCSFCHVSLDNLCVKCQKCKSLIHMTCTGLPEYQLVRLAVTSVSYVCMKCVETEAEPEAYASEIERIIQCKTREKALCHVNNFHDSIDDLITTPVNPVNENSNTRNADYRQNNQTGGVSVSTAASQLETNGNVSVVESGNGANQVESPLQLANDPVSNQKSSPESQTCKYYLRGVCKHGKKGTKCTFAHPAYCFKYTNKADLPGGCKKGKECQYAHPRLCWSYKKDKICSRNNCRFYHIKGTKLADTTDKAKSSERDFGFDIHATERRAILKPRNDQDFGRNDYPSLQRNVRKTNNVNIHEVQNNDFLELKQQMIMIQEQLQLLMSYRVQQPPAIKPMAWGAQPLHQ